LAANFIVDQWPSLSFACTIIQHGCIKLLCLVAEEGGSGGGGLYQVLGLAGRQIKT